MTEVVGVDSVVEEADVLKIRYLKTIMKETASAPSHTAACASVSQLLREQIPQLPYFYKGLHEQIVHIKANTCGTASSNQMQA
ncbi:hypothetical protein EJ110_NYTH30722 [Nymphaea thermarum]|nr:hypothetical protein EJ110_NYTH30722 [Nymphaea thermarum]